MTTVLQRTIMALIISVGAAEVQAADNGVTRFWNLTGETITHLYLAQSGTRNWGPDQCRNDPDGSVDFDERLRITGISSGHYDVKFTDKTDRTCIVKGLEIKAGAVFAIDKALVGQCGRE
jgi:hypothetical protein